MRTHLLALSALVLLTLAPAFAQAPPPANDPQVVAQQFLTAAQVVMAGDDEGTRDALRPLTINEPPHVGGGQGPSAWEMAVIVSALWGAWGAQPAGAPQQEGDKATVTFQGAPLRLLMTKVDGQWKVDLAATLAGFPEGLRKFLQGETTPADAKAQQAACLSNLKQLALAALMFASDNDDTFPDADKWTDQIMPYLRNEQVLRCPSAPGLECAYAMNRALSGRHQDAVGPTAEQLLLFDSNLGKRNSSGGAGEVADPPRHEGGNNFCFVDGHAKWLAAPVAFPPVPAPESADDRAARLECQNHLEQVMLAVRLYSAQHGQRLPDADQWTDQIMPYLQDPAALRCPVAPGLDCAYLMNRALSGQDSTKLDKQTSHVLLFESDQGARNGSGTPRDLIKPARHYHGNNYAYARGYVRWSVEPPPSFFPATPAPPGAAGPPPAG